LRGAEDAFGFIHEAMAVFDYYNDPNVKVRHQWAYGQVKIVMQYFEAAYLAEYRINISGQMQNAWRDFMRAHMPRVSNFAMLWCSMRLSELRNVWENSHRAASNAGDLQQMWFAFQMLQHIYAYQSRIQQGTAFVFDISIFQ
jgi:hypothetical protein